MRLWGFARWRPKKGFWCAALSCSLCVPSKSAKIGIFLLLSRLRVVLCFIVGWDLCDYNADYGALMARSGPHDAARELTWKRSTAKSERLFTARITAPNWFTTQCMHLHTNVKPKGARRFTEQTKPNAKLPWGSNITMPKHELHTWSDPFWSIYFRFTRAPRSQPRWFTYVGWRDKRPITIILSPDTTPSVSSLS